MIGANPAAYELVTPPTVMDTPIPAPLAVYGVNTMLLDAGPLPQSKKRCNGVLDVV